MSSPKPRRSPRKTAAQEKDAAEAEEKPITTLSRQLKNIARGLVEIPKLREHHTKPSNESESEEYEPEQDCIITPPKRRSTRTATAARADSPPTSATEQNMTSPIKSPLQKKRKRAEEAEPTVESKETEKVSPSQVEDTDPEPMGSPSKTKRKDALASPSKKRGRRKPKVDTEYTEGKPKVEDDESNSSSSSSSSDEAEEAERQRGRSPTKKRRKMSSDELNEIVKHPFTDSDIYDDADEDSAVEPHSAAAGSSATAVPAKAAPTTTGAVQSEIPLPKIIKTSPPPSPTKKLLGTRSPVKHLPTHDTAVQIHDRPKATALSMSSFLSEVQERSASSPQKTASPQKMPPPPMTPQHAPPVLAPKRTLFPMPEEQPSQDSMILLEIESSQDGSRSPSPAPPNFVSSLGPSEDAQF